MGSGDSYHHIAVVILNTYFPGGGGLVERDEMISSEFQSYQADYDAAISWSGRDLKEEEGWIDVANGSIFVRSSWGIDAFDYYKEKRDDVEKIGDEYIYMNGYILGRRVRKGIYHIIFPKYFWPTKIEYLDFGTIYMINARIMNERPVITWLYNPRIQLRVTMRNRNRIKPKIACTRGNLYQLAIHNLEPRSHDSEIMQEIRKNAVKEIFQNIPKIIKFFL